jgi:hypothetical protein
MCRAHQRFEQVRGGIPFGAYHALFQHANMRLQLNDEHFQQRSIESCAPGCLAARLVFNGIFTGGRRRMFTTISRMVQRSGEQTKFVIIRLDCGRHCGWWGSRQFVQCFCGITKSALLGGRGVRRISLKALLDARGKLRERFEG